MAHPLEPDRRPAPEPGPARAADEPRTVVPPVADERYSTSDPRADLRSDGTTVTEQAPYAQAPEVERGRYEPADDQSDVPTTISRRDVLARQRDQFGGVKVGSAFFGWLAAIGSIAILTAILAAVASGLDIDQDTSSSDLSGVGLGAAIALAVVLFLGYLAGGYVAGRMARFQGAKQGVAVWLWGVVIAIVLSIIAAIVGNQSTILDRVNLPSIPFTSSGFTWQAVVALVAVLVVTLVGAILGGLLGMRFHRRVDRFAAEVTPGVS